MGAGTSTGAIQYSFVKGDENEFGKYAPYLTKMDESNHLWNRGQRITFKDQTLRRLKVVDVCKEYKIKAQKYDFLVRRHKLGEDATADVFILLKYFIDKEAVSKSGSAQSADSESECDDDSASSTSHASDSASPKQSTKTSSKQTDNVGSPKVKKSTQKSTQQSTQKSKTDDSSNTASKTSSKAPSSKESSTKPQSTNTSTGQSNQQTSSQDEIEVSFIL